MSIRFLKGACLAVAVLVGSAIPANAQSSLGLGVSFLGDEGGTGLILDYAVPHGSASGDKAVALVGDGSFFHNSIGNDLTGELSLTTFMVQGGIRLAGKLSDKMVWHGQGLVGIRHSSFGAGGVSAAACNALNLDCTAGDTGGVLTIGGALQYTLGDTSAVRGQLDFPIALGTDGGSTTRFSISYQVIGRK